MDENLGVIQLFVEEECVVTFVWDPSGFEDKPVEINSFHYPEWFEMGIDYCKERVDDSFT
jgi:hypothetical protein